MTSLIRMRIELDDSPGSLADVASIIADYHGNITAIDVQRSSADTAVDELTVEFADHVDVADIRRKIAAGTGATLVSHQTANPVDPVLRIARQFLDALTDEPEDRAARLTKRVSELLGTPATWVVPALEAEHLVVGRAALAAPGNGCVRRSSEPLPSLTEMIQGDASLLAVTIRLGSDDLTVLVARSAAQGFTATEVSRVEALIAFHQRLAGSAHQVVGASTP